MDFSRHLLIDGYNVIHDWPELRTELRGGGAVARERLVEAVRVIHDRDRIRVTIVFDGRGEKIEVERPNEELTFSLVYSPASLSADDVIERLVGAAEESSLCTVVTRDRAERETIEALGAQAISPGELRSWVERTGGFLGRDLESHRRDMDRQWREGKGTENRWPG